jgi:pimeloyl-ACP methyl ester carboxylesterase
VGDASAIDQYSGLTAPRTLEQNENMSSSRETTCGVSFCIECSILHSLVEPFFSLIEQLLSELTITIAGSTPRTAAVADIIFIHGLAGDSQTTWQVGGDASTFWPLWIFNQMTNLNVWSLGYPAATLRWGKSGNGVLLPDRAKTILDLLCSTGIGSRPIIFVAHSLGGLLVKQLLRSAWELHVQHWEELAVNVRGIIFLGTPHTGSGLAALAKAISIFSGVTAQIAHNDRCWRLSSCGGRPNPVKSY